MHGHATQHGHSPSDRHHPGGDQPAIPPKSTIVMEAGSRPRRRRPMTSAPPRGFLERRRPWNLQSVVFCRVSCFHPQQGILFSVGSHSAQPIRLLHRRRESLLGFSGLLQDCILRFLFWYDCARGRKGGGGRERIGVEKRAGRAPPSLCWEGGLPGFHEVFVLESVLFDPGSWQGPREGRGRSACGVCSPGLS